MVDAGRRRHGRDVHRPRRRRRTRSPRCRRRPHDPGVRCGTASPQPAAADAELLAHGTTVATNALLERRACAGRAGDDARLRRRHRDRAPGPPVALRPVRRPAARRSCRGSCASRSAGGSTRRAARSSRWTRPTLPTIPATWTRSPSACCTPISNPGHEQAVAKRARGAGPRRHVLARGVARVPRVRAHRHDGRRTRACAPCAGSYLLRPRAARDARCS